MPKDAKAIIFAITSEGSYPEEFSADELASACSHLNDEYRAGRAIVTDEIYDRVFLRGLQKAQPDHPFLLEVEPESEGEFMGPTVRHSAPMLSTQKAYSIGEIERYLNSTQRAADLLGAGENVIYRITPKLDGIAANDDGSQLVTRGDGESGTDITHVLGRGVVVEGQRGQGRGEMVVDAAFFDEHLGAGTAHDMDHPRSMVAGFCSADTLKAHHLLAVEHRAIRFMPFNTLPAVEVTGEYLRHHWNAVYDKLTSECPYLTDGIVVTVANEDVRRHMGSTGNHERAVLAIKRQGEGVRSTVTGVRLTTGRTGRIVPTLLIEPVVISRCTVSKATAHTASNLTARGLGVGAVCSFVRAGEVIPKLVEVITPANDPVTVTHCPSCGHEAVSEGEHMCCPNTQFCPAQAASRLKHWFHTLGNVDQFGPDTIARLVNAGITDLRSIYQMGEGDFQQLGLGPVQSTNRVEQLLRSTQEPVPEWRFLASFGIRHLGRGDSKVLLQHFKFDQLGTLTPEQISMVPGFGDKTSPAIAMALHEMWPLIQTMMGFGFRLEAASAPAGGQLSGQNIVFTGVMRHGKRENMAERARQMGAVVQSGVTGTTTMLVIGEKPGTKQKKAQGINDKAGREVVRIVTEDDYLSETTMLGQVG